MEAYEALVAKDNHSDARNCLLVSDNRTPSVRDVADFPEIHRSKKVTAN